MMGLKISWSDLGLLFLRVGFGGMLIVYHGLEKLTQFQAKAEVFPDPLGLGRVASLVSALLVELGVGTLIIVGLWLRWAILPLLFTLVVIAQIVHQNDPWITKELAWLYAIAFTSLWISGPGRYSLSFYFRKKEDPLFRKF